MADRRALEDELLAIAERLYDDDRVLFNALVRYAEIALKDGRLRKRITVPEKKELTGR